MKLITASIAVALLAGCHTDNDGNDKTPTATQKVQAYDGAIQGIAGTYACENGETGALPKTAHTGFSSIVAAPDSAVITNPETCSFQFVATPGAVDVSNGKAMDKISLAIPVGLNSLQATPMTDLVAKKVAEGVQLEAAKQEVVTALGLDNLTNLGVTVDQLLSDLDGAIEKLEATDSDAASKLVATTHVLADVIVQQEEGKVDFSADEIANATVNVTDTVIATNPDYPVAADGSDIVVDVKDTVESNKDVVSKEPGTLTPEEEAEVGNGVTEQPSEPVEPPSTGSGSGSGGSGGGTGD